MTQMEQKNPQDVSGSPQLFGWCMYDWANSAYVTTVVAGVLPIYFASAIVGKGGVQIGDTVCQCGCPLGLSDQCLGDVRISVRPGSRCHIRLFFIQEKVLDHICLYGQYQRDASLLLSIRRCMADRYPISNCADWVCGGECFL